MGIWDGGDMVSNFHRFKHSSSYVGSTAAPTLLAGAASPSDSSSGTAFSDEEAESGSGCRPHVGGGVLESVKIGGARFKRDAGIPNPHAEMRGSGVLGSICHTAFVV